MPDSLPSGKRDALKAKPTLPWEHEHLIPRTTALSLPTTPPQQNTKHL